MVGNLVGEKAGQLAVWMVVWTVEKKVFYLAAQWVE